MTALENIIASRARLRASINFPRNNFYTGSATKDSFSVFLKLAPLIVSYFLNSLFSLKNNGVFHSIALGLIGRLKLLLKSNAARHPFVLISVFFIAGAAIVRTRAWKRILRQGYRFRQWIKV